MARSAGPGWYQHADGEHWWDGQNWTGEVRPLPLIAGTPAGWFAEQAGIERWWSGAEWVDARRAADGHRNVHRYVGQTVLTVRVNGGSDNQAIALLMERLSKFPPVRIEQIQTHAVMAGTNLIALVSWE